jgi:diguanylate cyclase (GGDEF)-like protein
MAQNKDLKITRVDRNTQQDHGWFDFLRDVPPKKLLFAAGIFMASMIVTVFTSLYIKAEMDKAVEREFDFICNEIELNITARLAASAQVLYSGAALFNASEFVSRDEWRIFTEHLRIEQQIPGTQGVGFSLLIPPEQLDQHIQQIRNEGYPDYTIKPEGERYIYSSIIYLEPFSGRNLRAFGYDMFSESIRRAAMERARDENTAILSGKLTLVQETTEDVQAGTLMYVPVYRHGMPIETVVQRRAAIQGWVYSPYRMNDLMQGALGNYEFKNAHRHITLQVHDGEVISAETLIYDSRSAEEKARPDTLQDISKTVKMNFNGRQWTLKISQLNGWVDTVNYRSYWFVLISGVSISLLLFGLVISLLRIQHYLESIKLLADMDALTGVFSRRKIIELAGREFVRARRNHHSLTLVMVDLNFFKHINDNFGHSTGDQALRLTAAAMQNTLRTDVDWIGRFGGDEFIVILVDVSISKTDQVIARLRANVAEKTQNITSSLSHVSLSIGAAGMEETTRSVEELIDQADRAMYADKKLSQQKIN